MGNSGFSLKTILKNKWVIGFLAFDAIVVFIIILLMIIDAKKTVTVEVNVAPLDAVVLIDGHNYKENTFRINPGVHEVQISREGLSTKTFSVDADLDSIFNITTFLSADGNFDFYTLDNNYASFLELARIGSADNNITMDQDTSAEAFIEKMEKEVELYQQKLPIDYTKYESVDGRDIMAYDLTMRRASDRSSCTKYLCIEAFMILTDDKNLVNERLEEEGFNMEDYEIVYKVY
ncbi:hypothetical protein IJG89_00185 [Candidatus Saccharibacteria bacterium]|nr:hypothetical protein [Candidatus Saccharibacteria bacterium]